MFGIWKKEKKKNEISSERPAFSIAKIVNELVELKELRSPDTEPAYCALISIGRSKYAAAPDTPQLLQLTQSERELLLDFVVELGARDFKRRKERDGNAVPEVKGEPFHKTGPVV